MQLRLQFRQPVSPHLRGLFGRSVAPDGAILHWDASAGWQDQIGNQALTLIGAAYPTVSASGALNESGKEWGFDLTSGAVRTAFLAGEATIVMQVTMPAMSSLTDATDYSLWGDLLFVRRDGTVGSFRLKDGTNTASVAYDWDEGEAVRVCVQCDGSRMCITNIRSVSTYPQTTLAQRTVRNLIKNSELSGTGTTPTGWTLYVNGGTCKIIPSSVWIGENAISASATWARVNLGYTLPSNLVVGNRYIIGCYIESISDAYNDDGLQVFTVGGTAVVFSEGSPLGIAHNGKTGWFMREFVFSGGTNAGPRFGVGVAANDAGSVVFSRPFLVDITEFSNESVFPDSEYVKTTSTDTTGKDAAFSLAQQSPNVSIWGDSLIGNSSMVAFMQSQTAAYVFNGGVGGETSGQIKTRFDAQANKHGDFTILWAGRNDWASPEVVKSNIALMVAELGHNNFIVVSILAKADGTEAIGSPTRIVIDQLNADLSLLYGDKFLELNDLLSNNNTRTDGLHLNALGSALVAGAFVKFIGLPSPWSTLSAPLPTDGQICKSHALPISAKKLTVFPGVASASQINEAKE